MKAIPLPARPSLEQYKKQAKELVREFRGAQARLSGESGRATAENGGAEVFARIRIHFSRFTKVSDKGMRGAKFALADAQLVIAREHGFESWPKFAKEVEARAASSFAASVSDPLAEFIVAACVPREGWHGSGTLEGAEAILKAYPGVAKANVFTAAILGEAASVRRVCGDSSRRTLRVQRQRAGRMAGTR